MLTEIWIVEYEYDGIGEAAAFSGAFTTEKKANQEAEKLAEEQKKEFENNDEACVIKMIVNGSGHKEYGVYTNNDSDPSDWWTVRKVPLD